ncbi:hypothetical protein [Brevundimonas balnearis]|uniref:Uncharacterized protein n=1 Tax=Brevundimonas balnearis TaxID=1572858 RepID=A0ABV6R0X5_9CAUL
MKVVVHTCARRRDDKFLITFRLPGGSMGSAISDREHREGESVVVRDGRVVR